MPSCGRPTPPPRCRSRSQPRTWRDHPVLKKKTREDPARVRLSPVSNVRHIVRSAISRTPSPADVTAQGRKSACGGNSPSDYTELRSFLLPVSLILFSIIAAWNSLTSRKGGPIEVWMRFGNLKEGLRKTVRYFHPGNMALTPNFRCAYKVVDDCTIYADVYVPQVPPNAGKNKRPVILAIHGGAFILGHSDMVNKDQIADCLSRGWITVSLEHRLCPQVDILEGPITDCRDALAWVHAEENGLDAELSKHASTSSFAVDKDRIVAFGTSSGGAIALALGWGTPHPPAAILDFYGATHFTHPFWTSPLPTAPLPPDTSPDYINQVYDEKPVPIRGGVSLEGQQQGGPPPASSSSSPRPTDGSAVAPPGKEKDKGRERPTVPPPPRASFALTHIARGTLLRVCYPFGPVRAIDAVQNVGPGFPPTCIVHGTADAMVPAHLSEALYARLKEAGVRCEFVPVEGEGHTFAGGMVRGGATWERQRRGFDWVEAVIS